MWEFIKICLLIPLVVIVVTVIVVVIVIENRHRYVVVKSIENDPQRMPPI